MAKFSGGTFKDGVLSYVYEAKPGGRKNNVNIKQINGEWFFVNKDGEVRDTLANDGKLSKTHIDNLKGAPGSNEENIFASANVSPETGKVSTPQGVFGPDLGTPGSGGSATGTGDFPGTSGSGRPLADRGNLQLAPINAVRPEMGVSDNRPQVAPDMANPSPYAGEAMGLEGQNFGQSWSPASGSNFRGNLIDSDPGANAPLTLAPSTTTDPNTSSWSSMASAPPVAVVPTNSSGGNWSPGVSHSGTPSTPASTSWSDMANANMSTPPGSFGPPGGGDQGMVAYKSGWSPGTAHSDMPSEPGITDQDDSGFGFGTAEGWNAAGSVMKGVGGLASAYTGFKNYELARDAHDTQKAQWQANYNQRLKAYEDNKKLANQEIQARNRTLRARGATTDRYSEL